MTARRAYALVDGMRVHYRIQGSGPVVMLFHDSPNSSWLMLPAMAALAARGFTAIAPDTPGYGLSDRFPGDPAEVDLHRVAAHFHRLREALGLGRVGVYGYHTGAAIAAIFAGQRPDAVAGLALNGYPLFTPAERADILAGYLPRFEPAWDGTHLAWLWARMREQTIFFPWHRADAAHRMVYDVPPPEATQASMNDFLRAGDWYRVVYGAVFGMDCAPPLARLACPTLVCAAAADPLAAHLPRLETPLPPGSAVERLETPVAALERSLDFLAGHPGDPAGEPLPTAAPPGISPLFLGPPGAQLHGLWSPGEGRPVLLLHGAGGSARTMAAVAARLAERRPVLALSLPGHGESDPPAGPVGIEGWAATAGAALDGLGIGQADALTWGEGALVARSLPAGRVRRLVALEVPQAGDVAEAERLAPSVAPRWDGAHVLTAWHMVRLGTLFRPWYRTDRAHARTDAPDPDTARIHLEVCELLKAGDRYGEALRAGLAWTGERPEAVTLPHDPAAAAAEVLSSLSP